MIDMPAPSAAPAAVTTSAPVAANVFTNPASAVHARAGQTFVIALPSNRTTGYSWALATDAGPSVTVVGSTYFAPSTAALGAGGQELWIFRALEAGTATLHLRYARPFDRDAGDAKNVAFRVVVQPR